MICRCNILNICRSLFIFIYLFICVLLLPVFVDCIIVECRVSVLGRWRRRWEDNSKLDFQKVGRRSMDWIDLTQDRDRWWALVNEVMNLRLP